MTTLPQHHRQSASGGHIVVLALVALLVGLSGLLTVPPLDRDESRFVQATTQMLETGDFLRIRFQDTERDGRPVGIYWLQATTVALLADVEDRPLWAFRMVSLLGVTLAVVFTYMLGATLFGRDAAIVGALILAASPLLAGEASIAKTDASLLAAICGMQAALAAALLRANRRAVKWFWVALGAGILLKGPIAPFIAATTALGVAFANNEKHAAPLSYLNAALQPVLGAAILAAMFVPWAVAIWITTEGQFFADILSGAGTGQRGNGLPPGYHLLVLLPLFWPGILFVPATLRHALPRWRLEPVTFCLAWLLPLWIVFELFVNKLPHHTMVLYPSLALLVGAFVTTVPSSDYQTWRRVGAGLFTVVAFFAAGLTLYLATTYSSDGIGAWHWATSGFIIAASLLAAALALGQQQLPSVLVAIIASGTFAWVAFQGVLPTLDRLALTPRLAEMLDDHEAHPLQDNTGPIALVGYHEPSAVFTLGTDTALLTAEEAAMWITLAHGRAVVVEDRRVDAFLNALPPSARPMAIASLEGFNYSNNQDMRLTLYRLE